MADQSNDGIVKICELKNFRVFKNFSWENQTPFGKTNLIYGWNYSGKTTLSRLFQMIEREREGKEQTNNDLAVGSYEIEYNKSGKHEKYSTKQKNIADFPSIIKVFNQDYINRILTWHVENLGIDPISFYLGDEAKEAKDKLTELENRNNELSKFSKTMNNRMS